MSTRTVTPTMPVQGAPLRKRVLNILRAASMRPHLRDPGWLSATALAHEAGCDTPTALRAIARLRADGHPIEHAPSFGAGMLRLAEHAQTVAGGST